MIAFTELFEIVLVKNLLQTDESSISKRYLRYTRVGYDAEQPRLILLPWDLCLANLILKYKHNLPWQNSINPLLIDRGHLYHPLGWLVCSFLDLSTNVKSYYLRQPNSALLFLAKLKNSIKWNPFYFISQPLFFIIIKCAPKTSIDGSTRKLFL